MGWEEHFDICEDESGKYHYPVWWVFNSFTTDEVAGPFDTEEQAISAAEELTWSRDVAEAFL
jgi:hypothetical protein